MIEAYYNWLNVTIFGMSAVPFFAGYAILCAISLFVGTVMFMRKAGPFHYDRGMVALVWVTATILGGFIALVIVWWGLPIILGAAAVVGLAWICVKVWEAAKGE